MWSPVCGLAAFCCFFAATTPTFRSINFLGLFSHIMKRIFKQKKKKVNLRKYAADTKKKRKVKVDHIVEGHIRENAL